MTTNTRARELLAAEMGRYVNKHRGISIRNIPIDVAEQVVTRALSDTAALREALEDFQARPARQLQEMGAAGRRWVAEDFTVAMYRQRMMSVYRELGVPAAAIASHEPVSASS